MGTKVRDSYDEKHFSDLVNCDPEDRARQCHSRLEARGFVTNEKVVTEKS
jgi:hypothetical protein